MRELLLILAVVGYVAAQGEGGSPLKPRDLRAVTILESPFMMLKEDAANLTGNAKYEGFIVDLIDEVADRASFFYRMYLVEDGRYGVKRPDNTWTGMVGDLLSEAQIKENINVPRHWPLCGEFTGTGEFPAQRDADIAVAPLTTTYTRAQVIDFSETFMGVPLTLLVQKGVTVNSLEELMNHPSLQYGARDGGMVADALQSTPERPYSQLWANMASFQPSAFFENYEEGIQRVLENRNFSIIMDKPAAEYTSHNDACDTDTQLEFYIGSKNASYAFGMSRTTISPEQRSSINDAIKAIIEDGTMETLRSKWWMDNCPAAACSIQIEMLLCILPLMIGLLLNKS